MNLDEKKELFLQIIKNWFLDESGDVDTTNCIKFYNQLLDCLEFEKKYTLELEVGFHEFLGIIIDKISELVNESPSLEVTKASILFSTNKFHPEQIDLFWGDLLSIYTMCKQEFFL